MVVDIIGIETRIKVATAFVRLNFCTKLLLVHQSHDLKNTAILQLSKRLLCYQSQNRRFVQRRNLLQEVVHLWIGAELRYRLVGSIVRRYFR